MKLWCKNNDGRVQRSWRKDRPTKKVIEIIDGKSLAKTIYDEEWYELPRDIESDEYVVLTTEKAEIHLKDRSLEWWQAREKCNTSTKIRKRYTVDDELKVMNLGVEDPNNPDYMDYRAYVDQCKIDSSSEIDLRKSDFQNKKKGYPIFVGKEGRSGPGTRVIN